MIAVSIIIPAYNCEKTIKNTLQSIKSQTFNNYEVIIVNDGSTDNTEKEINKFIKDDQRFKLFSKTNFGAASARNVGIEKARGEYIMFVDADDSIRSYMVESMYTEAAKTKVQMVICGYELFWISKFQKFKSKRLCSCERLITDKEALYEEFDILLSDRQMYLIWNKLIQREVLINNHIAFEEFSVGEDRLLNIAIYKVVNSIKVINEPLYKYYYRTSGTLTSRYNSDRFYAVKRCHEDLVDLYASWKRLGNMKILEINYLFMKDVYGCFTSIYDSNCNLSHKEKRKYYAHILNDDFVIKASANYYPNAPVSKYVSWVIRTKSVFLNMLCARIIVFLLRNFPSALDVIKSKRKKELI